MKLNNLMILLIIRTIIVIAPLFIEGYEKIIPIIFHFFSLLILKYAYEYVKIGIKTDDKPNHNQMY